MIDTRTNEARAITARFSGRCSTCGGRIEIGDEIQWWSATKKVAHKDHLVCECNLREQEYREGMPITFAEMAESIISAEKVKATGEQQQPKVIAPVIHDGYYSVEFSAGGYRTFRILTLKQGKNVGRQRIAYLAGQDYINFGYVDGNRLTVWNSFHYEICDKRILKAARALVEGVVDAGDAGYAYAMESQHCWKCGRRLIDPESIRAGIGPECVKKD